MDWLNFLKKMEERQEERKKELKEKTKGFTDTWESLKLYEKIMVIGLLIVGAGLMVKGCLMICAFANL